MVCHYALFFGRYNRALALVTGNNNLNAFLKVLLNDRVAPKLYRAQSRFVYNVGKLAPLAPLVARAITSKLISPDILTSRA